MPDPSARHCDVDNTAIPPYGSNPTFIVNQHKKIQGSNTASCFCSFTIKTRFVHFQAALRHAKSSLKIPTHLQRKDSPCKPIPSLARKLIAAGHQVAATTRNADKLRAEVGNNENLLALTDEADIKRGIAAITERFGRIDVTVNNAGYILVGAIEELTDAEIRANFDINVFGMMNVIRAVMPVYRAQRSGRFLNISSISGSVTDPGQAIYSASKAAVIMLTEAVDDEGRDFNVRATAVCPGGLRTSFLGSSARFP